MEPGRQPVGESGPPADEVARFRTRLSLAFPASEIHEVQEPSAAGHPIEMTVAFLGLTGPLGLLPHAYTELLIERARIQDRAFWEFLDLFNHRLISFFYRAWLKYRFPIAYERTRRDPFTELLFDVIGMGTGGLQGRTSVPDQGLLLYSGLIAHGDGRQPARLLRRPRPPAAGPGPVDLARPGVPHVPRRGQQFAGSEHDLRRAGLELPVQVPREARAPDAPALPDVPAHGRLLPPGRGPDALPGRPGARFRHPARPPEGGGPRLRALLGGGDAADAGLDHVARPPSVAS